MSASGTKGLCPCSAGELGGQFVPGQTETADATAVRSGLRGAGASLRREAQLRGAKSEAAGGAAGAGGSSAETEEDNRAAD